MDVSPQEQYLGLARDPEVGAHIAQYLEDALKELDAQDPSSKNKLAINEVPIARIKRIMKQDACDPAPRMISVPAILAMAYVALEFTRLLTSIAWKFGATKERRNTLQTKDLHKSVYSSQCFDFLIDVLDMFEEGQRGEGESGKAKEHQQAQLAYQASMQMPRPMPPPGGLVHVPPMNMRPMLNRVCIGSTAHTETPMQGLLTIPGATAHTGMPTISFVMPMPSSLDGQPQGQHLARVPSVSLARTPEVPSESLDEDQDLLARLPSLSQLPSGVWARLTDPTHPDQEELDANEPERLPSIDLLAELITASTGDASWQH